MKRAIDAIITMAFMVIWVAGAVLAPAWWKILAIFFPPYSLYLVVERAMQISGWIQ